MESDQIETMPTFNDPDKEAFGEHHFLLFLQCFLTFLQQLPSFESLFIFLSAIAFYFNLSKLSLRNKE